MADSQDSVQNDDPCSTMQCGCGECVNRECVCAGDLGDGFVCVSNRAGGCRRIRKPLTDDSAAATQSVPVKPAEYHPSWL